MNIQFLFFIALTLTLAHFTRLIHNYFRLSKLAELETKKLLYGIQSRRNLYNLTSWEFKHWCACLLRRLEYYNVSVTSNSNDGGKDIICERKGKKYYVECKKFLYKELADHHKKMDSKENSSYQLVGREAIQRFIGALISDRVYNGLIITTSSFNDNALEYVDNLPSHFNIELIDGRKLCNMYEEIIEREFDFSKTIPNIERI